MRIVETHSHLNGYEWLAVHQPVLISEIQDVLQAVDAEKYRTKISKEKNMKGKALFSPTELNAKIKEGFGNLGWHESRTSYWGLTEEWGSKAAGQLPLGVRGGEQAAREHFLAMRAVEEPAGITADHPMAAKLMARLVTKWEEQ